MNKNSLDMIIADIEMTGGDVHVCLSMDDILLTTRMASSTKARKGDQVKISLNLETVSLFDPVQGGRL